MKISYAIIFFGFLAMIMGLGKDQHELIPSEIKLLIGVLLMGYGAYLIFKPNAENKTLTKKLLKKDIPIFI